MLLKFFITCNKIGAFTLGGGYAMIPIMEREFVDNNHWMDRQEFMDIMVVAQTTPGIFSIDMASHVNKFFCGVRPAVVALIAAPCFKMARTADITWSSCWIPVASCLLIWLLGISPIWIILAAGIGGFLWGQYQKRKEK